jgi:hypothetical protein
MYWPVRRNAIYFSQKSVELFWLESGEVAELKQKENLRSDSYVTGKIN